MAFQKCYFTPSIYHLFPAALKEKKKKGCFLLLLHCISFQVDERKKRTLTTFTGIKTVEEISKSSSMCQVSLLGFFFFFGQECFIYSNLNCVQVVKQLRNLGSLIMLKISLSGILSIRHHTTGKMYLKCI